MANMSDVVRGAFASYPWMQAGASQARAVDTSRGYPVGDGSFADQVRGTQPQPERDLQFAMMSNDAYADKGVSPTGTQSERELAAAGWNRLTPVGDHLVDAKGNRIPIDPQLLHDPDSGFDAAIYQNDQGQYVVAYRGTDNWSPGAGGDAKANLGQGAGLKADQYEQAVALADRASSVFGDGNVAITGHSLGGGLASAAMLAIDAPGVTFNSAGLSDNTLRDLGLANPNAARADLAENGQIRRYNVQGELLTNLQQGTMLADAVGHELRVAKPDPGTYNPITLHGGGGDGASYVEALRLHQAQETNQGPSIDRLGEHLSESRFKAAAAAGTQLFGLASDAAQIGGRAAQEIGDALREGAHDGRLVEGLSRAAGGAANGLVDVGAKAVERGADLAGDWAREAGTFGGNVLRDVSSSAGIDLVPAAEALEHAGSHVNDWIDGLGVSAGQALDKGGDMLRDALDSVGASAQQALEKAADGIEWAGGKVADGAQWVGQKAADGAHWVGDRVEEGAQWVSDRADTAGRWASDRLGDVGRFFSSPFSR